MAPTGTPALRPAAPGERLQVVDVLRGFALGGILLANLLAYSGDVYLDAAQRDALPLAGASRWVRLLEVLLVENKFLGLFAALFGLGFSLQLERARARGVRFGPTYARRLGWLLAIGLVHGWLLWLWDVLRFYALWGTSLPLFARLRTRALAVWGLALAVGVPAALRVAVALGTPPDVRAAREAAAASLDAAALAAFSTGSYADVLRLNWAYDWHLNRSAGQAAYQVAILGRLVLGMWVGRVGFLAAGEAGRESLRRIAGWGLAVGVVGNGVYAGLPVLQDRGVIEGAGWPWTSFLTEAGFLGLTAAYAGGVALLHLRPAWRARLAVLAPVGRMALTNYLLQTAAGLWLFYGFLPGPHLMGRVGPAGLLPIWAAVFGAQVVLSRLWLSRFAFGPVEWLWRSLTYARPQPFRRPGTAGP